MAKTQRENIHITPTKYSCFVNTKRKTELKFTYQQSSKYLTLATPNQKQTKRNPKTSKTQWNKPPKKKIKNFKP